MIEFTCNVIALKKFMDFCHKGNQIFYQIREFNTFKESLTARNSKEPTLLGRRYLSTKVFCKQYLENRFELEDRPQVFCDNYDTSRYQIAYIKNRYLERKNL